MYNEQRIQRSLCLLLVSITHILALNVCKTTLSRSYILSNTKKWSSLGSSEKVSDEKTLQFLDWSEKQGKRAL